MLWQSRAGDHLAGGACGAEVTSGTPVPPLPSSGWAACASGYRRRYRRTLSMREAGTPRGLGLVVFLEVRAELLDGFVLVGA
jgi:hypothetical protein